jgi:hypothetical protein
MKPPAPAGGGFTGNRSERFLKSLGIKQDNVKLRMKNVKRYRKIKKAF